MKAAVALILTLGLISVVKSSDYWDQVLCTRDLENTKVVTEKQLNSIKFPIAIKDLVELLGLAYFPKEIEGLAVFWRLETGGFVKIRFPVATPDIIAKDEFEVYGKSAANNPFRRLMRNETQGTQLRNKSDHVR